MNHIKTFEKNKIDPNKVIKTKPDMVKDTATLSLFGKKKKKNTEKEENPNKITGLNMDKVIKTKPDMVKEKNMNHIKTFNEINESSTIDTIKYMYKNAVGTYKEPVYVKIFVYNEKECFIGNEWLGNSKVNKKIMTLLDDKFDLGGVMGLIRVDIDKIDDIGKFLVDLGLDKNKFKRNDNNYEIWYKGKISLQDLNSKKTNENHTEQTPDEIQELKDRIDGMTHEELARVWRFGIPSNDYLQGEVGEYLKDRLYNYFGGITPRISKMIGW
jgi:hypothetical protein